MQHIFAKVSYFNIADVQRQDPFFSGIKKKFKFKISLNLWQEKKILKKKEKILV